MVFMEETAEQVAWVDPGWLIGADKGRSGGWIRRLQPERPVRPMGVVVLGVDSKGLLEAAMSDDQQPVQALGADGPDPALRVGVGVWGACTGVTSTSAPSAQNTSSKLRVNFASRSRTRKRTLGAWGIRIDKMLSL
jgi:hypothetical protein